MRIGHGYDVHRFANDRELVLGGVKIDYELGLLGHSDADVLIHAIMDAVLGALAKRDIGYHFPDTDPRYKGISSMLLARELVPMLKESGMTVSNIDATIIAQVPKLSPYIDQMKANIADAFDITPDRVNVKATTEEGLGFTGEKLGIAAHAVCLLE